MSDDRPTVTIAPVGAWAVDGLPGLEGRLFTIEVPPGLDAPVHHHDGWQFVYVLTGTVTSRLDGETEVRRYDAGDAWYEPPGRRHVAFGNPSDAAATVLVFFLTEPGSPVLTFDRPDERGG